MAATFCVLPLPVLTINRTAVAANDDSMWRHQVPMGCNVRVLSNVKDRNRLVLSGRLSDVCAALDALAHQERMFLQKIHAV